MLSLLYSCYCNSVSVIMFLLQCYCYFVFISYNYIIAIVLLSPCYCKYARYFCCYYIFCKCVIDLL